MKFLCLGYFDEKKFNAIPDDQKSEILRECFAQCVPFRATGKVVDEEALESPSTSKCIRPKNGKPTVTDGPFIETKEQLGSFFIIEAETLEEAIEVASLHPGAFMCEDFGAGIEVRQVHDFS